ncbi:MAG TPA: tetratricopeptide repeat protein, partial [Thermomicrobiales bacterium]|nr:tetratricopeptide repeat protein [Thermomicrobiales bacterium]
MSPFVGRTHEAASIIGLLRRGDVRLVTLTGPGGVGKTRLALEVARSIVEDFPDGVRFVALAPITNPGLVASSVAQVLGVRELGEDPPVVRLEMFLRDKHLLLLLDNFEHVVEAAPLAADLLAACPDLKILTTSRVRLRLSGEREYPVPPLALPAAGHSLNREGVSESEAVRLFTERAQAVKPDFALIDENADAVAEICHRLDGLPLAIELAAARVKVLHPTALLSRLEKRLPLLSGGGRDLPARQHTMRDTISWSYDLLSPDEQALFRRLSVFAGGFTLEATEVAVAPHDPGIDLFEGVASLMDRSLLRQAQAPDSEPRYSMLETVREYGLEQLDSHGEADAVRWCHAAYFLALVEQVDPLLRTGEQQTWLGRLEADHANLRVALGWAIERGEAEMALRLAGALHWFWYLRGHWNEGRGWLKRALELPSHGSGVAVRVKALTGAGVLAFAQSDYPAARAQLQESLAICRQRGDPAGSAYALHFLGMAALLPGQYAVARDLFEESVEGFRRAEDPWGLAMSLCSLGVAVMQMEADGAGDHDDARVFFEESLALFRERGDTFGLARALQYVGEAARALGDYPASRKLYEESLTRYRALDHRNTAASVVHNLGYVAQHQGDLQGAASCFAEALAVHVEHGDRRNIGHCLGGLAGMVGLLGPSEQAARLFGAADAMFAGTGASMFIVDRPDYDRNLAMIRDRLGEQQFAAAFAAGQMLPLDDALAEAAQATAMVKVESSGASANGTPTAVSCQSATDWYGLTAREREVLQLLVDGRTDRAIAEALFI